MAECEVLALPPTDGTFVMNQPHNTRKRRASSEIPHTVKRIAMCTPPTISFDPEKHLNFQQPSRIWTMKEMGLENAGISPTAVSEPFSLFTEEAIQQMRAEVLSEETVRNCQYSSNLAQCTIRGCAPEYAPFVYQVWRDPQVLSIVSKIAGVELVPQMDFEIGHINISVNSDADRQAAEVALAEHKQRELDEGVSGCGWEDDHPIVDWHTDSYPFVCVTMLSDCAKMVGGETALRTGTGEVMKVRGPTMGNAVILQGRYIEHQALRALGGSERITMVTSFRPKSALVKDDTVLTTVRAMSDLSELYSQYTDYRLEMLKKRIDAHLDKVRSQKREGKKFDTRQTKDFIREQDDFLASMLHQMVDEDEVTKGFTDDSHLLSADLKDQCRKRAKILGS